MTDPDPFESLMREVMARTDRFGHREHVHLTWLAIRRYGATAALTLISDGIRRTATYAGAPVGLCADVLGRDRRLERVRPGRVDAPQNAPALLDPARIPQRAVLVVEQHELLASARLAPRILEEHQRKQAEHLGLVRHQGGQDLREPDRLRGHQSLAPSGGRLGDLWPAQDGGQRFALDCALRLAARLEHAGCVLAERRGHQGAAVRADPPERRTNPA